MKKILLSVLKKIKIQIIIIFICVGLNIFLLTSLSKIIGIITDLLYNIQENKIIIYKYVFLLIVVSIFAMLLRVIWKYFLAVSTRIMEKKLKDKLFEHFIKIKLTNIQNIKNGEIMSYFVKDVGEIRRLMFKTLSQGTRIIYTLIIVMYSMKVINLKLTIATMCPIIITGVVTIILKKYVEISFKKSQHYFTKLSEYVQESTDAIRTTKAYSGETSQLKKFIKRNEILKKSNVKVDLYSTLLSTSVNICFGFCYGIAIIYGSRLVLENNITIGDFVAFIGYINLFYNPIYWIPSVISALKKAQISYHRLDNVFCLEEENLRLIDLNNEGGIHGDISIKNLSFNYPGNIDRVIDNISINIKEGQTLGIIGTIGSGKTTLMNLLLKLYPIPNGKIFIDGNDLNNIDLTELRNSISYITQDNFLFSTTIRENISLFKEDFSDEEIIESTKESMISNDISNMKNGIYTIIGERGIDLSGGQKQRVVISRAFLNKSNIIIFDDTFSALDNKTEKSLLENIKKLVKDKTCIIISNRISDVKDADNIIVLDNGKIIEQGTHTELLKNNGLYNKFYNQQSSQENSIFA